MLETVYSGRFLRVLEYRASDEKVILTFDHWRKNRSRFPKTEQHKYYRKFGVSNLCLESAANDWFVNPDLPDALDALAARAGHFQDRRGIGFSMGAYGALLVSAVVDLRRLMLVSPQAAAADGALGCDDRFSRDFQSPEAAAAVDDVLRLGHKRTGQCLVVYDPRISQDLRHANYAASLFERAELLDLPGGGHPATGMISGAGRYNAVVRSLIGEQPLAASVAALHEAVAPRVC